MKIKDYSLQINGKSLIENCDLCFHEGTINHIVGKNGVGKSQMAKDFLLNNSGKVPMSITDNVTLISSVSNVPQDITKEILLRLIKHHFSNASDIFNQIYTMFNIEEIPSKTLIKNLSDGQKQKLKLLSFLLEDKPIVILDEITNALDKKTINEIYKFLNTFIDSFPSKTIINITHNLSDLSNLPGKYFILKNKQLDEYKSKDRLINDYIHV
ncbi:ATP-binding cassette domain-containing protein [Staphylococcus americanisciuri]|uniref:ATP-binding cassette domain-containing protein n=1 Tax=Staphylococcus americanisciuri TaxID=2973940 RepID=A0ABT2F1A1_9STAP|nr:ATP-binding cassette domain-containing protein [Staphylococcus americanisciuri]MCS4485592.1 ATP-binding cassette domain-containing protein [Staphylococcus americanisciuri]